MKVAIVRVRGSFELRHDVRMSLRLLNLHKKNHCTIVEYTPIIEGMLHILKPYCTWGLVDEKTEKALSKKGKNVFALNPPRKGYGRKGVKMPFSMGGAYGDRKEKINDLLTRMM